jgi:hypothetical protein
MADREEDMDGDEGELEEEEEEEYYDVDGQDDDDGDDDEDEEGDHSDSNSDSDSDSNSDSDSDETDDNEDSVDEDDGEDGALNVDKEGEEEEVEEEMVVASFPAIGLSMTATDILVASHVAYHFPSDCSVYFLYYELTQRAGGDKFISRTVFDSYFSHADSSAIGKFFDVFDRHFSNNIDIAEFCVGASLLFPGSLESKLKFAFQVLSDPMLFRDCYSDALNQLGLSNRGVWLMVRSYILVLWAVFGRIIDVAEVDSYAVDVVAAFNAQACSVKYEKTRGNHVRFVDILRWLKSGYASNADWFSLLDLRGWLEEAAYLNNAANRSLKSRLHAGDGTHMVGMDSCPYQLAYELKICCSSSENFAEFLPNYRHWVRSLLLLSPSTRFCDAVCEEIVSYSTAVFGHGKDSDEDIPFEFYAYLCIALSLLCSGSKSSKLDFAFRLLSALPTTQETEHPVTTLNVLGEPELTLLLLAYMRGLHGLAHAAVCPGSTNQIVSIDLSFSAAVSFASELAASVCQFAVSSTNTASPGTASFDQFGRWYNCGGFEVAPWLEMINLAKWIQFNGGSRSDRDVAPKNSSVKEIDILSNDDDSADDDETVVDESTVAFIIPLYSNIAKPFAMGVPRSDDLFIRVNDAFVSFAGISLETMTTAIVAITEEGEEIDNGLVTATSLPLIVDYIVSADAYGRDGIEVDEDLVTLYLERFHRSVCCLLGGPVSTIDKDAVDGTEFGEY